MNARYVHRALRTAPELDETTVHLTLARRVYALADRYCRRGAKIVLGGLHVLSCPDQAAPYADALAAAVLQRSNGNCERSTFCDLYSEANHGADTVRAVHDRAAGRRR